MEVAANVPVMATIYRLRIGEHWYVGSTIRAMNSRMYDHYKASERMPERKLYRQVTGAGGWGNVTCEVIATMDFTTKTALLEMENQYIRLEDPFCLNSIGASRQGGARGTEEFREYERQRLKAYYERKKEDPAFMEKKRKWATAVNQRRREARATAAENGIAKD